MSRFYDYDPQTGAAEIATFDADADKVHLTTLEDVGPLVEQCKTQANHRLTDPGIKRGFWLYASIPNTVILEMRKKGIDIFDKNCAAAMFRELDTNYPYLKTTSRKHSPRRS